MDPGVRVVCRDVLIERLHRARVRAVGRVRRDRPDGDVGQALLDQVRREGASGRRHAERARAGRAVDAGLRRRRGPVRIEDRDDPEDAEVVHPLRPLDQRSQVQAVGAGGQRGLDRELEPRDLARPDVGGRLDRDAVVSRPAGGGRTELAVATEHARAVLARLGPLRAEVRDLSEPSADPAARAGVVVRDGRDGSLARAEGRVGALAIPLGMESGQARGNACRWRDPRADGGADAGRGARFMGCARPGQERRQDQRRRQDPGAEAGMPRQISHHDGSNAVPARPFWGYSAAIRQPGGRAADRWPRRIRARTSGARTHRSRGARPAS